MSRVLPRLPRRLAVAAAIPLLLALAACGEAQPATPPPAPVVRTMAVAFAPDVTEQRYSGTVGARHVADQAFRVGGKIVERLVDVGDEVAEGQPIARLDAGDLDLYVGSAEAELVAAEAAFEQATADEARSRQLRESNFTSGADYDRRQLAVEEARGRLGRAERQLQLARNQRGYTTLAASTGGVVTAVSAEVGQVVAEGQAVATIASLAELEVEVAIPESELAGLAEATPVVTLWSNGGHEYGARLRELSPRADPVARTYDARFSILAPDAGVHLGMTATVTLRHGGGGAVARLPSSAIFNEGDGPAVFVIDPARSALALRPVEVLRYGADEAVIASGLAEGDEIVTLGVSRLEPDLRVRRAAAE
jgi:RND family efflux transporter MFP subunit